MYTDKAFTVN